MFNFFELVMQLYTAVHRETVLGLCVFKKLIQDTPLKISNTFLWKSCFRVCLKPICNIEVNKESVKTAA